MILVSIVTVVLNGEKFIEQTIQSVITQNYSNIEYIIIDGGSSDNTKRIVNKYKNQISIFVSEPDDGQSDALIKGFSKSKGDILCWLNYDDLFYNDNVISLIAKAFEKSGAGLMYGNDLLIDSVARPIFPRFFNRHSLNKLLYYKSISQPSCFFSRAAYGRALIDEKLVYSMDIDLWLKMFKREKVVYIDQILSCNRIHSDRKMISGVSEARLEANYVRIRHGANKKIMSIGRLFFKFLDMRNNYVKLKYYISNIIL